MKLSLLFHILFALLLSFSAIAQTDDSEKRLTWANFSLGGGTRGETGHFNVSANINHVITKNVFVGVDAMPAVGILGGELFTEFTIGAGLVKHSEKFVLSVICGPSWMRSKTENDNEIGITIIPSAVFKPIIDIGFGIEPYLTVGQKNITTGLRLSLHFSNYNVL